MNTKNILMGAGLIGASIFVLPKLLGGKQTSGGGGGSSSFGSPTPYLISGLSGTDSTKKGVTKKVTNIYNIPSPTINESDLSLTPTSTKKETKIGRASCRERV